MLEPTYVVPDIRRHLDRFLDDSKKPSHITQLRRKIVDVAPYAYQVAEALGLPAPLPRRDGRLDSGPEAIV